MNLHGLNLFPENFSIIDRNLVLFPFGWWAKVPNAPGPPHYEGFAITLRRTTVGRLLWPSDQPVRETCAWQHTALQRDIRVYPRPCGIQTHNLNEQAAIEPSLRLQGHWNRLLFSLIPTKSENWPSSELSSRNRQVTNRSSEGASSNSFGTFPHCVTRLIRKTNFIFPIYIPLRNTQLFSTSLEDGSKDKILLNICESHFRISARTDAFTTGCLTSFNTCMHWIS